MICLVSNLCNSIFAVESMPYAMILPTTLMLGSLEVMPRATGGADN